MQGPVRVCHVELSRPDPELVTSMTAVVEEKLQALESSLGVKNPALQQRLAPLHPNRCAQVHEITLS